MSQWAHEHPELVGTDADPWMANPGHAAAHRHVQMYSQFPNLDAMIAEAEENSSHVCNECCEVQKKAEKCAHCGGELMEREP